MKIIKVEAFDLYGDGTLIVKTDLDEIGTDTRFAWYLKKDGRIVFKSSYQRRPFYSIKLNSRGVYNIKAFVKNDKEERLEKEITFKSDQSTSPDLKEDGMIPAPKVERIGGMFWRFALDGKYPSKSSFAWYIYQKGESKPIIKKEYMKEQELVHNFDSKGEYRVKVFARIRGEKHSSFSEWFTVD